LSELAFPGTADALGRLRFDDPELVANELRAIAGKRLRVIIKRLLDTRSMGQNRLLWGHLYTETVANAVDLVEIESGLPVFQTREDVHGFGKLLLLRRPVMTNRGELNLLGTTTTLTTAEFNDYMERLCAKLATLGVYIPPVGL